jgi:hypothetical protein
MNTKVSALKRAVSAAKQAMGPQQYGVRGKPFVCHLCGNDRFRSGSSIIGLRTLACSECSRVEFFAKLPPVFKVAA